MHVKGSSTLKMIETNGGLVYFHLSRNGVNISMHGLDGRRDHKWPICLQQNAKMTGDCKSKFGSSLL